jgi:uncharacterized protein
MDTQEEIAVDINNTIETQLQQLEIEEQIVILYACESGSRAWGFPSPDSDYDVRFIYLRPLEWYLSIDPRRDTIDLPVNALLDINGWDLRKALKLFKGSNSTIYEWCQSPIVYQRHGSLDRELLDLANSHYDPRGGIYHYLNSTIDCYQKYLRSDVVKLKKYFYALRPILAAKWIIQQQTFPPMVFAALLKLIEDRQDVITEIDRLLAIKATANESTTIPTSQIINDFIEAEIERCSQSVKLIPRNQIDSVALDNLFKKYALSGC